jgi:predicted dehydrogenase
VSDKPIRVAVVGVGEFGRNHVRVWREVPGAELVGIVDANAERARTVAAEFGTRVILSRRRVRKRSAWLFRQRNTLVSAAAC